MKYTVIKDTREKTGWDFDFYEKCEGVLKQGLKTGDYTAVGLEDHLRIERKASTAEIALNLGRKREQFDAEMERIQEFRWKYIVCEFSEDTVMSFPQGSTIPKARWRHLRMNGKFMRKRLYNFETKYGVEIIFTNGKEEAEEKAIELIEAAYKTLKEENGK